MKLVLASSSPYRHRQLQQLGLPFTTMAPALDETALPGEQVVDYVRRLALAKARGVGAQCPGSLVIGSDQACHLNGLPLGKPADAEAAFRHLKLCQGNWVEFVTGLALVNTASGREQVTAESFRVKFRALSDAELRAYIRIDHPLDCAGSFKVEAAGIALFDAMEGRDYNSLVGLPMMALVDMLVAEGVSPLLDAAGS